MERGSGCSPILFQKCCGLQRYFRADAFPGKNLEEKGMGHASVDDVDLGASGIERFETGRGLGQHAACDRAVVDERFDLLLVQRRDELLVLVQDARLVGEQNQFLRLERARHGPYEVANGTSTCANAYCHGVDLSGVAQSGPSCNSGTAVGCHSFP